MHVSSLHIHPLKSGAALDVETIDVVPRGPVGDRRWMIVDGAGRFVTARAESRVVSIRAVPVGDGLHLSAPGCADIGVDAPDGSRRTPVRIWNDDLDAALADDAVHAWLSAFLGRAVRLVRMDERSRRPVNPVYGAATDEVSFADGYPLLVVSQAALDGLNARLARPVGMSRFRPNVVVDQAVAHAEDHWRRVRIGAVEFDAVKRCTRCVFTTIDPATAQRDPGREPLATLGTYRRASDSDEVYFGMNLIARGAGSVRRGDAVEVLATR